MSAERPRAAGLLLRSALAWLWFASMFFGLIPGTLLFLAGAELRPPLGPGLWIGGAIALLAQGAVLLHVLAFVREGRGTHAPLLPPEELIGSGLYRHSRNPMYLLYALTIAAGAVAWRSWLLLAYAAAFCLLAHLYVVRVEEVQLKRRFGAAYADYCARVPRWLGRAPR